MTLSLQETVIITRRMAVCATKEGGKWRNKILQAEAIKF